MKHIKPALSALLTSSLLLLALAGCGGQDSPPSSSMPPSEAGSLPEDTGAAFSYSDGIDENGFWEGITALDHVELFDYGALAIPSDRHTITDDDVQNEIDRVLAEYAESVQVTNRAVADGDTVNIDYVGSVDGVEFDGGSTGGAGTEVTIGVTNYIDDFLEQLIGRTPGETFNVEVTFPANYGVDTLNGKDAVFVTTINHIVEAVNPELTDGFVADNLAADNGWTSIAEMNEGVRATLQKNAIITYIKEYIASEVAVSSLPEQLTKYQENVMLSYYSQVASYYSMELEDFLSSYMGIASVDQLVESNRATITDTASYYLVLQAIAEDAGIAASDEDVASYLASSAGDGDFSEYEAQFGLPYLKQATLCQLVLDYLIDHAVLT